jgi:hypothetical protein
MTLAAFALGEASIAQAAGNDASGKKAPASRTATAVADQKLAPEPR